MQGLLLKLTAVDSMAERGLRVVTFFDELVGNRADTEAVVRGTAVLAETTAGAYDDVGGASCVVSRHGHLLPAAGPSARAIVRDVWEDGESRGSAWIEPPEQGDAVLHELILERMCLALSLVQARQRRMAGASSLALSDPAVLQALIRPGASEADRSRAATLLGFAVGQRVVLVALHMPADRELLERTRRLFHDAAGGRRTCAAAITAELSVVIVAGTGSPHLELPPSVTACTGPAVAVEDAALSWEAARRGVLFAGLSDAWPALLPYDAVGAFVLLALLDTDQVARNADVRRVADIAASKNGTADLELLEKFCAANSIRDASVAAHLHHSSVVHRVATLSDRFGFELRTGHGRQRAHAALLLWRLHVDPVTSSARRAIMAHHV